MLKNFGLQARKDPMDHAAFMAHWLGVHAPLSQGVGGVRGYVINETVDEQRSAVLAPMTLSPPLDGIAQLWFDSREAMMAVTQTPEAKRWFSDGVNYLGARTGLATSEREIVAMPRAQRPRFKVLRMLAAATGSADAFRAHWQSDYAPHIAGAPGVKAYVQSDVTGITPATNMPAIQLGAVSGVDEIWVDSVQAAAGLAAALETAARALPADSVAQACTYVMHETVII